MSVFVLYAKLFEYDFGRSSVTDNREHERLVNFFGGKVKMSNIIDLIESEGIRKDIPDFQPGDTVRVFVKVVEGNRERLQAYEGLVIARKNGGIRETFTVRRISYGVGAQNCTISGTSKARLRKSKKSGNNNKNKIAVCRGRLQFCYF